MTSGGRAIKSLFLVASNNLANVTTGGAGGGGGAPAAPATNPGWSTTQASAAVFDFTNGNKTATMKASAPSAFAGIGPISGTRAANGMPRSP